MLPSPSPRWASVLPSTQCSQAQVFSCVSPCEGPDVSASGRVSRRTGHQRSAGKRVRGGYAGVVGGSGTYRLQVARSAGHRRGVERAEELADDPQGVLTAGSSVSDGLDSTHDLRELRQSELVGCVPEDLAVGDTGPGFVPGAVAQSHLDVA